jgi:hypothetical protein
MSSTVRRRTVLTRGRIVALTAGALVLASGAAWAATTLVQGDGQTEVGTGTGAGELGSDAVEVTPQPGLVDLAPGSETDFSVRIDNPNDYPVRISKITGASRAKGECGAQQLELRAPANLQDVVLPAGGSGDVVTRLERKTWGKTVCGGQSLTVDVHVEGGRASTP